ncbi:glycosyltransferase [Candidatus Parcubacteria bacterium]|nr:glycosyltransferase [Candidatus Parcubacteria bacterium]
MRVALVHDYLTQYGGSERVLGALCELFPDAPIYTLLSDDRLTGGAFRRCVIRTSFLQRWPLARRHHRLFLPFMPLAAESFNLAEYDLVISDSASFAKGVITKPSTLHINYCHTPTRYLWLDSHRHVADFPAPRFARRLMPAALTYLRLWDIEAAGRVDYFVANSRCVAERIRKFYRREAAVIYPPVFTDRFQVGGPPQGAYLMVGRLLPYKSFDIAIHAFNLLRYPLIIVGDGPERRRLERLAGPTVNFLGLVSDAALRRYYQHAAGFVFAGEDDFGIAPVEAMACGRPVIAYGAGGALETVVDGVTGVFFSEQTPAAIAAAVKRAERLTFYPERIREHALRFDAEIFKREFRGFVEIAWQTWQGVRRAPMPVQASFPIGVSA